MSPEIILYRLPAALFIVMFCPRCHEPANTQSRDTRTQNVPAPSNDSKRPFAALCLIHQLQRRDRISSFEACFAGRPTSICVGMQSDGINRAVNNSRANGAATDSDDIHSHLLAANPNKEATDLMASSRLLGQKESVCLWIDTSWAQGLAIVMHPAQVVEPTQHAIPRKQDPASSCALGSLGQTDAL